MQNVTPPNSTKLRWSAGIGANLFSYKHYYFYNLAQSELYVSQCLECKVLYHKKAIHIEIK